MTAALRQLARELRHEARREAHRHFDQLWKGGRGFGPLMTRPAAYELLAAWLGCSVRAAHIAHMTAAQCFRLVQELKPLLKRGRKLERKRNKDRGNGRRQRAA